MGNPEDRGDGATGLEEFAYLWDGSDPGWVLWDLNGHRAPFHLGSKSALIIEDDVVAERVVAELVVRGVNVITEYPT